MAAGRYTIEELSARTGMPTRRIRYYQTNGVLPAPERQGRTAVYRDDHLRRLELIAELHEHGLRLGAIAAIVARSDDVDPSLARLLRTESRLAEGWDLDAGPTALSAEQVDQVVGHLPADTRADLIEHGFIRPQDDGTFLVNQPAILDVTVRLLEVGIDVETAAVAGLLIQPAMADLARDVVSYFLSRLGQGFTEHGTPDEVDRAVEQLRPAAAEAAAVFFTHAIGEAISEQLAAGGPDSGS